MERDRRVYSFYLQNFLVLGDEKGDISWEIELTGPSRERDQIVIVDEVVAAQGDQNEPLIYQLLSLVFPHQVTHSLLVLLEVC